MTKLRSLAQKDYLKYGLHLAILIGVIWAAVKYLNGQEVLSALQAFNYRLAPFILLLSTGYMLLKAWRFVLLMAPFSDGVPWLVTYKAYIAGQAATLLPGGIAARAGLMKQVNVPVAQSSVPVLFSSGLDQVVFLISSLIAALWFEDARVPVLIVLGVVTAVVIILLLPPTRRPLARAADWLAGKVGAQETWRHFLDALPDVLTWQILLPSLALTVVAYAAKLVALDLSLRGVGLELGYPTLFLGFVLPTMLGRIAPIPGGVGVTEAGMVGFLAATSQANPNQLTAAVAVFRIGTVFFEALLGAIVYFFAWNGEQEVAVESAS
ncbi:MAG: flippase-like domain-containing protein [Anaerolineales bacterium]|nr:flippase-like domain-containing protein [Anaerolineales bacterium]